MATKTRYAAYPSAVVYKEPGGQKRKGKTPVQHLLWGDWLRLKDEKKGKFQKVHARGVDGWMHEDDIQEERLLEVVFVDVGQGDGCLLITPQDEAFVIDAGQIDNMYRFLRWRFGKFKKPFSFKAGIMSHPDQDHYGGFDEFFDDENVSFETLYHNGIMERKSAKTTDSLGPKSKVGRQKFLTDLIKTTTELKIFLSVNSRWKRKKFPTMLKKGVQNQSFKKFAMLSNESGHVPGFGPSDKIQMQVLGPVEENGGLRWLKNVGMTKNGHSVVIRLQYKSVSMLLGGDLNIPSEELLLAHHTGINPRPKDEAERFALVDAARKVFQVDIAKSCHHGSSDFSSIFLDGTHPIATVISSGDNESHSHPRADALGSIGLHSRGTRPLIFNTEIARSAAEDVKHPQVLRTQLNAINKKLKEVRAELVRGQESLTASTKKKLERREEKLETARSKIHDKTLNRSIAVYGAITVRTDGDKVVLAQKLEKPRGKSMKWDIYRLEREGNGPLQYQSKH